MSSFLLIVVCLLLAACSSNPIPPVNYYILDEARGNNRVATRQNGPVVVLDSVQLAEYLNQANMAMQLNGHQMYYSRQHLWAESLQKSIRRALLSDLNRTTGPAQFTSADTPLAQKARWRLRVDIDHFVATDAASVLMAGTYWLTDSQGHYVKHSEFHYSKVLEQDGFEHAVGQLRSVLNTLSNDITVQVEAASQ